MDNMDIDEDEITNKYNVNYSDDENNNDNNGKNKRTKKFKKSLKKPTEDLDYFMGYKYREDNNASINTNNINDSFSSIELPIPSYSSITKKIASNFQSLLLKELKIKNLYELEEKINYINEINLFELISNIIKIKSNILIYGFGSKIKLIYNFINYFQNNINNKNLLKEYHIIIFNLYNPEMTLKIILNELQNYIINYFNNNLKIKNLKISKPKNSKEHIQIIKALIKQLKVFNYTAHFLLILNNIDGINFQNKIFQNLLSELADNNSFNDSNINNYSNNNNNINNSEYNFSIQILATVDNCNIPLIWSKKEKEKYNFYFLKYNTYDDYSLEINNLNGLNGEKNIKSGIGLREIIESFSSHQKELIKIIAELQLNEEYEKLTPKGLVGYIIEKGKGICNTQDKLEQLIFEAVDHQIVKKKISNKIGKEIYKLDLDKDIINNIIKGEYDKKK